MHFLIFESMSSSSEVETRLSLCDIIMPHVYIRSLVIYDYHIVDLEESFNEHLHSYCPQAFKCIVYDQNNSMGGQIVNCEDKQVFSRESRTNESLLKYINDDCSVEDIFPYGVIPTDTSPLIFLHQIHFEDGTLLSFGCHHLFSDGHGFSLLGQRFSLWLKEKKSTLFDFDRSKLINLSVSSSIKYSHSEMSLIEPIYSLSNVFSIVKSYTKEYLFSKLEISDRNLSMNDVLVGWITQLISRIRHIPSERIVKIGMAMNGRMFLSPDINENYFGNCSFYVCLTFLMSDLTNLTVNELAHRINMEKRKFMKREYILSALSFINKHHRTSMIHLGWESSGGIDLSFSNWSRFPLFKCDFGQGQPKAFKIPSIISDGLIFILPTLNNDEIQLHITLKHQHAQLLLNELI